MHDVVRAPDHPLLAALLLPVVTFGFAAVWTLVALYSGRQCSWMAVIGALDVLWLLTLAPRLAVRRRAVLATLATGVLIAAANWFITAANVGAQAGAGPLDSIGKLGPHYAVTLAGLANRGHDAAWLVLALAVAAVAPWFSARRRASSAR